MEFVLMLLAGVGLVYLVTHLMIGNPWPNTRADRAALARATRKDRR